MHCSRWYVAGSTAEGETGIALDSRRRPPLVHLVHSDCARINRTTQSASAPAFARAAPNTSYEEELLAAVKARGGAALPSLTSSPAVEAPKQEKKSAPAAVVPAKAVEAPTPRPSINGKELPADAPTIKLPEAAKSESVGSFASYASAPASAPKAAAKKSEDGGNNNAVVLGGLVLVAVAGVAVAGGNNGEGADGAGVVPAAPAAGGVSAGGVSSADDEVKKVQAWIAAYKKRSGMA